MLKEVFKLFMMAFIAAFFWVRFKTFHFFKNLMWWRKHELRTLIPKGHSVYEFNPKTGELVKQGKMKTVGTTRILNREYKVKDFKIKRGCVAVVALNDKNAIKVALRNVKRGKNQPDERGITIRQSKKTVNA